jgi:ubiquitin C-terminal hydrolase
MQVKKQRSSFKKKDYDVVNELDGREKAKPSATMAGGSPARRNHSWESESTEEGISVAKGEAVCSENEKFTCILARQDELPVGLRGMNNMGNTCFMNSILQALLRTPTLSEYYLQSRHFKGNCRVTMEGGHCVECELDAAISDIFSGGRAPYSPTNFLHTWWMMAGGLLSGYKQQDSHEFFLFILQMLTGHPRSVATSLYIGYVQSEISCGLCGSVKSRQRDEFSHVSLDVISSKCLLPPPIVPRSLVRDSKANGGKRSRGRLSRAKKESTKMNGKDDSQISQTNTSLENRTNLAADVDASFSVEAGDVVDTLSSQSQSHQTVQNASQITQQKSHKVEGSHPSLQGFLRWPGDSLIGCLKRFIWPEVLDKATHSFTCSECKASSASTKQFSFLKLPPILTFHLKRFEHTGSTGAKATKLETFISFPLNSLDMQPFLTSRISLINEDIVPQESQTGANTYYDAFAVVCHRGTFQGGHYVCYVRCDDNNWYLCDDAYVAQVSEDVVRNCQAYMVFYSLQSLCPWNMQGKN